MRQATKQRIVGTVVLLSLLLIFLPIIFDGQGSYQTQLSSRIPETPVIPILPEPTQLRPVIVADSLIDETEQQFVLENEENKEDSQDVTIESPLDRETPRLGATGLPQGWSVRLGSFARQGNADNLMERLRESGYKAYTRTIENAQGRLTSVFVGPWLDRALVDQYKIELEDQFRLTVDIVQFEVEEL